MKRASLFLALCIFVGLLISFSCSADEAKRPDTIYSLSGEAVVSLGDTVRHLVEKLGPLPGEVPPSLLLDADQIEVPVPVPPKEPLIVKNKEFVFSLIAASDQGDGSVTHDRMVALLDEHGLSLDDLSSATESLLSKADEREGVFLVNSKLLKEMFVSREEGFAASLELYEYEKQKDYSAAIKGVRSSAEVTRLMASLMFSGGKRDFSPAYPGVLLRLVASDRDAANDPNSSYFKAISSRDMEVDFNLEYADRVYSSVDERDAKFQEALAGYLSRYESALYDGVVVSYIDLTGFKYVTFDGDYVGMKLSDDRLAKLGYSSSSARFFAGLSGVPVELSGDYIRSLSMEEKANIDGLFSLVTHVDGNGFIDRITYMYMGKWK